MNYSKQLLILDAYRLTDLCALFVALMLAASSSGAMLEGMQVYEILSARFTVANMVGVAMFAMLWLTIFRKRNLYSIYRKRLSLSQEVYAVAWAVGLGTFICAVMATIFDLSLVTREFLVVFALAGVFVTILFRKLLKSILEKIHLGDKNHSNVMIVGHDEAAEQYAELVRENAYLGYSFAGYLLDSESHSVNDAEVLGSLADFKVVMKKVVIDEIVLVTSFREYSPETEALINYAAAHGIMVRMPVARLFSGIFEASTGRLRAETFRRAGERNTVDLVLASGHQLGWRYLAKRLMDVVGATLLLIAASPIMIISAFLIRFTSKGNALFVQDRYGYNGRVFKLYKFRTMVQDADAMQEALRQQNELDGAAFKIKSDPRITGVGKWLRKTSIDELPQLLNVIKGDMSLVGPRPLPLPDYQRFKEISHMRRLSVLPGITCTWQAGGRNNVSFEEWMKLDMDYIDNWSLGGDIKILLKTVPAVLFARGAS